MTNYLIVRSYLEVVFGGLLDRIRHDERGSTAEVIVVTGAALLGVVVVAAILWGKLKGGAEGVTVPAPAAP